MPCQDCKLCVGCVCFLPVESGSRTGQFRSWSSELQTALFVRIYIYSPLPNQSNKVLSIVTIYPLLQLCAVYRVLRPMLPVMITLIPWPLAAGQLVSLGQTLQQVTCHRFLSHSSFSVTFRLMDSWWLTVLYFLESRSQHSTQ